MTLREYYQSLPSRPVPPKTKLVRDIMSNCGVEAITARAWLKGQNIPSNPEHRAIISRMTGIPEDELFQRRW